MLESHGFDVVEAQDGREGLARTLSHLPDLVLSDIAMPVMDGFGLAIALRRTMNTRHVPLVFLTAETEPAIEAQAYDVGAVGFFTKPYAPHALLAFIGGLLMPTRTASGKCGTLWWS